MPHIDLFSFYRVANDTNPAKNPLTKNYTFGSTSVLLKKQSTPCITKLNDPGKHPNLTESLKTLKIASGFLRIFLKLNRSPMKLTIVLAPNPNANPLRVLAIKL